MLYMYCSYYYSKKIFWKIIVLLRLRKFKNFYYFFKKIYLLYKIYKKNFIVSLKWDYFMVM